MTTRRGKSMLLGLSKIIDCPGQSVPFSTSVDLSDLRYGISCPVSEPVLAQGVVRNTAGVQLMKGSVSPMTGITNRHMPTLASIWNSSIPTTPTQM